MSFLSHRCNSYDYGSNIDKTVNREVGTRGVMVVMVVVVGCLDVVKGCLVVVKGCLVVVVGFADQVRDKHLYNHTESHISQVVQRHRIDLRHPM